MTTASTGGRSSQRTPTGVTRAGVPRILRDQTGSVSTVSPPMRMTQLACPAQVRARVVVPATGIGPGSKGSCWISGSFSGAGRSLPSRAIRARARTPGSGAVSRWVKSRGQVRVSPRGRGSASGGGAVCGRAGAPAVVVACAVAGPSPRPAPPAGAAPSPGAAFGSRPVSGGCSARERSVCSVIEGLLTVDTTGTGAGGGEAAGAGGSGGVFSRPRTS